MSNRRLLCSLVLASFVVVGCGDSDGGGDDAGSDAGPDTGTPAPVDAGTDTGPPVMTSITCGSTTCSAPMPPMISGDAGAALPIPIDPAMLAGMGALPCCTGADATNPCGVMSATFFPNGGCIEQDMPGVPDPACPSIETTFTPSAFPITIPIVLPGCCTAMNQCGLDLSAISAEVPVLGTLPVDTGVGCIELTQADMLGSMVTQMGDGGPTMSIPCGADDGGADDGG